MKYSPNAFIIWGMILQICYLSISMSFLWGKFFLIGGFVLVIFVIKKFYHIPFNLSHYGNLESTNISKVNYVVKVSHRLPPYRLVEIPTTFLHMTKPQLIIINKDMYLGETEAFVNICIDREILKFEKYTQVKHIIMLIMPVVFVVSTTMLFIALGVIGKTFFSQVVLPVIGVVFLFLNGFIWNKHLQKEDFILDSLLAAEFSEEDIVQYILRSEEIFQRYEKSRYNTINKHYAEKRISMVSRRYNL